MTRYQARPPVTLAQAWSDYDAPMSRRQRLVVVLLMLGLFLACAVDGVRW